MAETTDRLRRLLTEELDDCCEADVEDRLRELDELADETTPSRTETDARVLSTLGDDTRYRLARLLVAADEELCVCELESLVDVGESAVSHALADLADVDLVDRRKDGKWRYYRATDRTGAVLGALDATRDAGGRR